MSRFTKEMEKRAHELLALYPEKRSATIPLCHLAQEQNGYLTEESMVQIADLVGTTPAEVLGTASFYDMLHTEPVGKYVVGVCTNIACLLQGGEELLGHAEEKLGIATGATTDDGMFTLEDMECIAHCDHAPALQVNYRFFGPLTNDGFDTLVDDLSAGKLESEVPPHGTLSRVQRKHPIAVPLEEIVRKRRDSDAKEGERLAVKAAAEAKEGSN